MLMSIFWLAVVIVPAVILLAFMVRGRRLRDTPACPRCRHCVVGQKTSTCSECGHDLAAHGVIQSRRQPVARGWRLLALFVLAIVGFFFATELTWKSLDNFIFQNVTPRWWMHGSYAMRISLARNPIGKIRVVYPGWVDPEVSTMRNGRASWLHGQKFPLLLEVVPVGAPAHSVLIERNGEDVDVRAMSSSTDPDGPGSVITTTTVSEFQSTIGSWLVDEGLAETPESPIAGLSDHLVVKMLKAVPEFEKPLASVTEAPASFRAGNVWDDSTEWDKRVAYREKVGYMNLGAGGVMVSLRDTDYVKPWMLLVPTWCILWIVIGFFVLLPNARVAPWTPAENG